MEITSAKFITGIVDDKDILHDGTPQIAFIGRSNAGKSSLLNSLTNSSKLAITSKTPGRTKEINVFLINNTHYFMDLPGYGYAKASGEARLKIFDLIFWYLFKAKTDPRVVMLIDAVVGPTADDLTVLHDLEDAGMDILIVANKVDRIKKSQYQKQLKHLQDQVKGHKLIPYSSKAKIGIQELAAELLSEEGV